MTIAALDAARALLASDADAAAAGARAALAGDPASAPALRLLGAALRKTGATADAEQAESRAIAASAQNPRHREAARLVSVNDRDRAAAILQPLLAEDGDDVLALVLLGGLQSARGDLAEAERNLEKAAALAPAEAAPRLALAEHFQRIRRASRALEEMDRLPLAEAASRRARSLRADLLRNLGRHEEEIILLEALLADDPGNANFRARLAHALRTLGRTDAAIGAYRRVLTGSPFEGSVWSSLANLKTFRFADDDITTMERGLAAPGASPANRTRLHFALGKALEDRGEHQRSFEHYAQGNRLRAEAGRYDPGVIGNWIDSITQTVDADFLAARAGKGSQARDPIFLVGMPRSGSTLVEQILASHPQIEGTAELVELATLMRELGSEAQQRGQSLAERLAALDGAELAALGDSYVERTRAHRVEDRPFFTDKMPNNWLHVPVIRAILPRAKIVDIRRNPMDCCFSNWKQLFARGLEHSYAMDTMGEYYADYVRLMRHMDTVDPGGTHRVIYEDLVEDLEGEVRRLLDYLELDFNAACLAFHDNDRAVRTISAQQVRQPLNRRGLGQWKPYEAWLGPLKTALGDTLDHWRG